MKKNIMAEDLHTENRNIVVYLIPHKIQKQRYKDMVAAAQKRNIHVVDCFSDDVTHIVTEYESRDQAINVMKLADDSVLDRVEILRIKWFTDSMRAKKPVAIEDSHRLKPKSQDEQMPGSEDPELRTGIAEWSCLRSTPLKHFNTKFCNALEILQKYAELRDGDSDYSRALAFCRASCVLKSLPFTLTSVDQVRKVKDIGKHVEKVLKEILEDGFSLEVQNIIQDPWFQKMKLFTSVFGVGPSTAKRWIESDWTSIEDASRHYTGKDWRIQWGLSFHDDLENTVTRNEAEKFTTFIKKEAEKILPDCIMELTGGFRRGKPNGHDIDILFSHKHEGRELNFLTHLVQKLESLGLILCGKLEKSSYSEEVLTKDFKLSMRGQLDHFEKWIGIIKSPKSDKTYADISDRSIADNSPFQEKGMHSLDDYEPAMKKQKVFEELSPFDLSKQPRDWVARRVDLIVCPYSQYYFALVGWTGSKQFNRDLRLYAAKKHNMKGNSIPASSEKEVFDILQVPYFPPEERNC